MAVIKVNGKIINYADYEDIVKPEWKEKMRKNVEIEQFDYHLSTKEKYGAWINYNTETIYINLRQIKEQFKAVKKELPELKFSMNDFISSTLSHEEIHRCIYFLEGREATRQFDTYIRGQLNKKNVKRLIEERMW